jgi:mono/diheme cytochrome c family protein
MRYAISHKLSGLGVALILVSPAFGGDADRGKAIFALAAGCGCHTPEGGPVGAGGRPLATPFGTFYSTNITPDPDTGLGRWSDAEIRAAIRVGDLRDGSVEAPVMPYYQYAGMADEDVDDLIAYLRTLPPVRNENRRPDMRIPLPRIVYRGWRWWFTRAIDAPPRAPAAGIDRGRYLVDHVSLCGDCHTPRGRFGALRSDWYLAGTRHGPDGKSVPNITTDATTGAGDWTADELVEVLRSGMLPDFDNVQGLMAEMVDGYGGGPGYKDAPEDDVKAMASYLKTVPPIVHDVREDSGQ